MRPLSPRPDTSIPLREHLKEIATLQWLLSEERDRRYAEVSAEREKALKIKDAGNEAALQLARDIQTYKDEKANELREQINTERIHYASKDDLASLADKLDVTLKPIAEFVARSRGGTDKWGQIAIGLGLMMTAIALFLKF